MIHIHDILPDEQLDSIEELGLDHAYLGGEQLEQLEGLEELTELQALSLSGHALMRIPHMPPGLKELDVSFNAIDSLEGVNALASLASLNVGHNDIRDIGALAGLEHLERLVISGNRVRDVSALRDLDKLSVLYAKGLFVKDWSCLGEGVSELYVSVTGAEALQSIGKLIGLTSLHISAKRLQGEVILPAWDRLTSLTLTKGAGVTKLTGLEGCPSLQVLNLDLNGLQALPNMSSLTALESLSLRYNHIRDFTAVVSLTSLKRLDIHSNPIDGGALAQLQAMREDLEILI